MSVGRNLYARQKKQTKNIELIVFLFVNCFGKKTRYDFRPRVSRSKIYISLIYI